MENLTRYLAEESSRDIFFPSELPWIGYASLAFPDGQLYSDFTASQLNSRFAEAAILQSVEQNPRFQNRAPNIRVYDLGEYPYHVAISLIRAEVKDRRSAVGSVRLLRTRCKSRHDVKAIFNEFIEQSAEYLRQRGETCGVAFYGYDQLPLFIQKAPGIYWAIGAGVSAWVAK